MIGLDTNVLVRYIVGDDPGQAAAATRLIDGLTEADPGFISVVTLVELHWVLRSAYKVSRPDCARVIAGLMDSRELTIAESQSVRRAVARLGGDVDFADALISELGRASGCEYTATFDKRAARLPGMRSMD